MMGFTKVNVLILVLLSVNLALSKTILQSPFSQENVEAVTVVIKDSKEMTKPESLGKYFV